MSQGNALARQKVTKEFEIALTGKEVEKKVHEMSALLREIKKFEGEQKESNAAFKAKIDERYAKLGEVGDVVDAGKELRVLNAEMEKDFSKATKRFFHDGKLILEEPMMPNELQMSLEDAKQKKTAKDGRREDAEKAEASKKKATKKGTGNDVADVIALEKNRKTKRSTVDGVYHD